MHCVHVQGGNKTKRDLVSDACYFFIKKLMPRIRNIEIEIHIKKMTGDAVGYCMLTDSIRDYEIELANHLDIRDLMVTLAHEMVHVKQYVQKEMDCESATRWKTSSVSADCPYYELPWEKEAYRLQVNLAKAYWMQETKNI
jgi:hypothetical protein